MKKVIIISVLVIIAIIGTYLIGTGFLKESEAYISDYTVSADGSEITIDVGVASSIGYVRKVSVHQQDGGKLYLDCYSTFGGLNGSWGAKSTYTISLDENTTTIALYRNTNCYEVVLEKDSDGVWQRVK